jgi:hypothetical protein
MSGVFPPSPVRRYLKNLHPPDEGMSKARHFTKWEIWGSGENGTCMNDLLIFTY